MGGIAVAYALVEILLPDVLTSPDSAPAGGNLCIRPILERFDLGVWHFQQQLSSHHHRVDQGGPWMGLLMPHAPIWIWMLNALCLAAGTTVSYRGNPHAWERQGEEHMMPGQGASAELRGPSLIETAGFTELPINTTHIITSGIADTMITGSQGLECRTVIRIALA